MLGKEELKAMLERFASNTASEDDRSTLRQALLSREITVARREGDIAMADGQSNVVIGGDAQGSFVITGGSNIHVVAAGAEYDRLIEHLLPVPDGTGRQAEKPPVDRGKGLERLAIAIAIGIGGIIVSVALTKFGFVPVPPCFAPPTSVGEVKITRPSEGESVGRDDTIEGETDFPSMYHYIVVIPKSTGTQSVQDRPAIVSGHTWSGQARFGEASLSNEIFDVKVLATYRKLTPGSLTDDPVDAKQSKPITVRLK